MNPIVSITQPHPARPAPRFGRGFTLIELLTVIAIIGILAAIIIPVTGKVRESARRASCTSNLRQISLGVHLYADDNHGRLPGGLNEGQKGYHKDSEQNDGELASYLAPYLHLPKWTGGPALRSDFFICPSWTSKVNQTDGKCYVMNMAVSLDGGLTHIEPFGRRANSSKKPILLSQLANQLSTTSMMFEVDARNVAQTGQSATEITWEPVHGNTRNVLYFDGRVKPENVN